SVATPARTSIATEPVVPGVGVTSNSKLVELFPPEKLPALVPLVTLTSPAANPATASLKLMTTVNGPVAVPPGTTMVGTGPVRSTVNVAAVEALLPLPAWSVAPPAFTTTDMGPSAAPGAMVTEYVSPLPL